MSPRSSLGRTQAAGGVDRAPKVRKAAIKCAAPHGRRSRATKVPEPGRKAAGLGTRVGLSSLNLSCLAAIKRAEDLRSSAAPCARNRPGKAAQEHLGFCFWDCVSPTYCGCSHQRQAEPGWTDFSPTIKSRPLPKTRKTNQQPRNIKPAGVRN